MYVCRFLVAVSLTEFADWVTVISLDCKNAPRPSFSNGIEHTHKMFSWSELLHYTIMVC